MDERERAPLLMMHKHLSLYDLPTLTGGQDDIRNSSLLTLLSSDSICIHLLQIQVLTTFFCLDLSHLCGKPSFKNLVAHAKKVSFFTDTFEGFNDDQCLNGLVFYESSD